MSWIGSYILHPFYTMHQWYYGDLPSLPEAAPTEHTSAGSMPLKELSGQSPIPDLKSEIESVGKMGYQHYLFSKRT